MRIQRSWVMCVLTITALVIAVHEAQAQSYPYAGTPPMVGDYPGAPTQMQPGMAGPVAGAPGLAPQYYSGNAMGAPGGAMPYAPTDYSPQAPAGYAPQSYRADRLRAADAVRLSAGRLSIALLRSVPGRCSPTAGSVAGGPDG